MKTTFVFFVDNPLGCTLPVALSGAVPNEHGTWLYGRDGWCDGQDVAARVTDVTHQVKFIPSWRPNLNSAIYFRNFLKKQYHLPIFQLDILG